MKTEEEIKRPSFEQIYMRLALDLEKRSTCERKQVGCVLASIDFRTIFSIGYNGNASGLPNKCDFPVKSGGCGCLHAEENAVLNCDFPRQLEKYAFITWSPCSLCAKRLVNLGNIKKVYYRRKYKDGAGLKILESCGILTEYLPEID